MSGGGVPPFAAVGEGVRRRDALLVLLCLAATWVVVGWPWLSGAVTIPYDAKAHFHAQLQFLATALHSGQSPFWTPNVFAGSPQVADPQSLIFSPAFLVALFDPTPSFRTVDTYVLALLLIGGASVSAFGLSRGWHPAAALLAGIAFAFGGSAYWRVQHIGQIQSYACLGLSLWLFARALDRPGIVAGLVAGAAVGLMIVTPDQVAYLGVFVLAGLAFDKMIALRRDRAALLGLWRPLLGGALGTIAVAALPLVMTVLFAAASNRPEIELSEAVTGSLHPGALLTLLLGDLFGAADPRVPYWGPSSEAWATETLYLAQNMTQLYAGALVGLLVIGVAAIQGVAWRRDLRVFTLLGAVFLLYALGRYTPVFAVLFDHVPGVAAFRRPADATFLIGAMASILAGASWRARGGASRRSAARSPAGARPRPRRARGDGGHAGARRAGRAQAPGSRDGSRGSRRDRGPRRPPCPERVNRPAPRPLRGDAPGHKQRDHRALTPASRSERGRNPALPRGTRRRRLRLAEPWPRARLRPFAGL
jgi:hypothetical protein